MAEDAASLERLQDIVLPPEISWWPLAAGWYLLAVILLALLIWLGLRLMRSYRRNAYRRAALAELQGLRDRSFNQQSTDTAVVGELAELLRRTALAAAPRNEVAALSGLAWHEFLNESLPRSEHRSWDWLDKAYQPTNPVSREQSDLWFESTRDWVRNHQARIEC